MKKTDYQCEAYQAGYFDGKL